MGSFSSSTSKFVEKTIRKLDLAYRMLSLELFSRVILKSPVRSGRFRGNWQVQIGGMPSGTLEIDDKTGSISISKADAVIAGLKPGDTIFLVNNLPYAGELENGSSKQAPSGMVALSIQEAQEIANAIGLKLVAK